MEKRLLNEVEHGAKIVKNAGEVWSWETPAGKLRWKRRVQMLTNKIKPQDKILELGCGTGFFTKELIKTKAEIHAIDISPDLINVAMKSCPGANYKIADAHHTDFTSSSFDKVIGSSVLHHLEIEASLKEIYRLLKEGGEIFFTEPNMMNPQIALQKNIPWLKEKMGDSKDETAYFRWVLERKLKASGFKNIELVTFDFLHPSLPLSIANKADNLFRKLENIPVLKEIAGSIFIYASK